MTSYEHYRAAEGLLRFVERAELSDSEAGVTVAMAQVHATLATVKHLDEWTRDDG